MADTLILMTTTTPTPTVKAGSIVVRADDDSRTGMVVTDRTEAYVAPAGMFLINTGTADSPWFTFGMLTGRTRQRWGMACPTIARFTVETIARDGVILGVPGDRIPVTWTTRPENID